MTSSTRDVHYNIEAAEVRGSAFGGHSTFLFSGWCFAIGRKESVIIELRLNGQRISKICCEKPRPDVEAYFGKDIAEDSSLPRCGFEHTFILNSCKGEIAMVCVHADHVLERFEVSALCKEANVIQKSKSEVLDWIQVAHGLLGKAKKVVSWKGIFRLSSWIYWFRKAVVEVQGYKIQKEQSVRIASKNASSPEEAFLRNNSLTAHVKTLLSSAINSFTYKPLISVIMPVHNADPLWLTAAIESVVEQIYPNWELCIADDASTREGTLDTLRKYEDDGRTKLVYRKENGHISRASNDALALATGEFIVLLDHDDLLESHALFEIVYLLQSHTEADLIYSDEDKIDSHGKRYDLHFKPDWSPTLLLGYNYINHLACIRRTLVEEVGRFRIGYEGAQDYDLLLRAVEKTHHVFHIPKILYHWRAIPESTASSPTVKTIVKDSAQLALADYLKRQGIKAAIYEPEFARAGGYPIFQLAWPDNGPEVSIVIPTYNQGELLKQCIDSIIGKTT